MDGSKKNKGRKLQPSLKNLVAKTGFRHKRIKQMLEVLRNTGLLTGDVPTFQEKYLLPKKAFKPATWWKDCTGRNVVPSLTDKQDVLHAFVLYQNVQRK